MRYSEAKPGRIFVIRLEDGETVHEVVEGFAQRHSIKAATLTIFGGADAGSDLTVGPEEGRATPISPMYYRLRHVHEVAGVGTLFPDEEGNPILHMHMACGRNTETVTGCIRQGVKVWHVMEVILMELLDTPAVRRLEEASGFKLLQP